MLFVGLNSIHYGLSIDPNMVKGSIISVAQNARLNLTIIHGNS